MNNSEVIDLDILRPTQKFIKLGGKSIDVSFIPCGINFEIDALMKDLTSIDRTKLLTDVNESKKAFDLGIRICSTFCSHKNPEMTSEWFYKNTTSAQISAFVDIIKETLIQTYKGVEEHSKNLEAVQETIE